MVVTTYKEGGIEGARLRADGVQHREMVRWTPT